MTERMMRIPPHSMDYELALLAVCLVEPTAYPIARGLVDVPDFYGAAHGAVWDAMRAIHARGEPVDTMTVRAELVRREKLWSAGGDDLLLSIADRAVDPGAVELYATRVREYARHRALLSTLMECVSRGYEQSAEYREWRASVERAIRASSADESDGDPTPLSDVLASVVRQAQETAQGVRSRGLSTGIDALTRHLTGWQAGRLYIVAGRPGMGKSALVTSTVLAASDDDPILVFSLEMPETENGQRILAAECGVDLRDLTDARLTRDDWTSIARGCESLHRKRVYVHDQTRTIEQITAKARRFAIRNGRVAAIVVDYLQLVHGDKKLPREQQISEVTRELKALAKELNCAVIALSQLNRECESRPDKRPRLSDLRESGAIEQDADAVLLVYRRGYYAAQAAKETQPKTRGKWDTPSDIEPGEDDGKAEIIVAKMRGGPQGIVHCQFTGSTARFTDAPH